MKMGLATIQYKTIQLLAFVAVFFKFVSTTAETNLKCPSKWHEGKYETLQCRVQVSEFNDQKCQQFQSGLVDFKFAAKGSNSLSSQCLVQDVTTSCGGAVNSKGCRCSEERDGFYLLELKVQINRSLHEGGTWRCVPQCLDGNLKNKFDNVQQLQCGQVDTSGAGSRISEKGSCGTTMLFLLALVSLVKSL